MIKIIKESMDDFEVRRKIASLITKNNKGELDAIEGYQELLSTVGDDDSELVDIINEIISDEKNHVERLSYLMTKYDDVIPSED